MYEVLYVQVLLEKNEHYSTPVWLYPWEVPVFSAVHRDSGITTLRRQVFKKPVAPNAETEFERLANKYKAPEGTDIPYVVQIYGHGAQGLQKLQAAMVEAAKETAAVKAEPDPEPEKPDAPQYESPFGEPAELPPDPTDQASLRDFVSGGDDAEPVAISA